jgi:hypothetical protein
MNIKTDKVLERIDPKDFLINIDELKTKTQQIASESVAKIDPKDFQRDIEGLQTKTQRIVAESTEKMKRYKI